MEIRWYEKDSVCDALRKSHLKQESPRIRSIFVGNLISRLSFPWVSIGICPDSSQQYLLVYFHDRPWTNCEEIYEIARIPPSLFHTQTNVGHVCIGPLPYTFIRMYPSDCFWMTTNSGSRFIPFAMRDVENPDRAISQIKTYTNRPGWLMK